MHCSTIHNTDCMGTKSDVQAIYDSPSMVMPYGIHGVMAPHSLPPIRFRDHEKILPEYKLYIRLREAPS